LWCHDEFIASKGQMYCSFPCRIAANQEATVIRKEVARRERRKAAAKRCVMCGALLSMYGVGNTCATHSNPNSLSDILKQIRKKV